MNTVSAREAISPIGLSGGTQNAHLHLGLLDQAGRFLNPLLHMIHDPVLVGGSTVPFRDDASKFLVEIRSPNPSATEPRNVPLSKYTAEGREGFFFPPIRVKVDSRPGLDLDKVHVRLIDPGGAPHELAVRDLGGGPLRPYGCGAGAFCVSKDLPQGQNPGQDEFEFLPGPPATATWQGSVLLPDGTYTLEAWAEDVNGGRSPSAFSRLVVKNTPPEIRVKTPDSTSDYVPGQSFHADIVYEVSNSLPIRSVRLLDYSPNQGASENPAGIDLAPGFQPSAGGGSGVARNLPDGQYAIVAQDSAGVIGGMLFRLRTSSISLHQLLSDSGAADSPSDLSLSNILRPGPDTLSLADPSAEGTITSAEGQLSVPSQEPRAGPAVLLGAAVTSGAPENCFGPYMTTDQFKSTFVGVGTDLTEPSGDIGPFWALKLSESRARLRGTAGLGARVRHQGRGWSMPRFEFSNHPSGLHPPPRSHHLT